MTREELPQIETQVLLAAEAVAKKGLPIDVQNVVSASGKPSGFVASRLAALARFGFLTANEGGTYSLL